MCPVNSSANGKLFPETFKMVFLRLLRLCSLEWRAGAAVPYPLLGSLCYFTCHLAIDFD